MFLKQTSLTSMDSKKHKKSPGILRVLRAFMFKKLKSNHDTITPTQYQYIGDNSKLESRQYYQERRRLFYITRANQVYMKNQNFIQNLPKVEEFQQPVEDLPQTEQPTKLNLLFKELFRMKEIWKPTDQGIIIWNMFTMVLIFSQMLQIPLALSFNIDTPELTLVDYIVNCCFMLDILIQFNTAIYSNGKLQLSRIQVSKKYLQCWFWVDLVSSFPYDLIFDSPEMQQQTQIIRFLRFFKFIKVIRLLRALKLRKIFARLEEYISVIKPLFLFIQILKLFFIILCISHWCACIWNLFIDAADSWAFFYDIIDEQWEIKYITSIYFSITTIITVGYGDIHAYNYTEQIYAIFLMLLASAMFGYTTNIVMALFLDETELKFQISEAQIKKYMKKKNLSKSLQFRVSNYLEWVQDKQLKSQEFETKIFALLSSNLRSELVCLINGKIVKDLPFISCNGRFSKLMITNIAYAMYEVVYGPEEVVFEYNSIGQEMYFIMHGNVSVYNGTSNLATISARGYFGEVGLFCDQPRSAKIYTQDYVNLMVISRKAFLLIAEQLSVDLETYYEMKYFLDIERDYKVLMIKCYFCEGDHLAKNCPQVHFIPDAHEISYKRQQTQFILINRKNRSKSAWHYLRNKTYLKALKLLHQQYMKRFLLGQTLQIHHIIEDKNYEAVYATTSQDIDQVKIYESYIAHKNVDKVILEINEKAKNHLTAMKFSQQLEIQMKASQIKRKVIKMSEYKPPQKEIQQKFKLVIQKSIRQINFQQQKQQQQQQQQQQSNRQFYSQPIRQVSDNLMTPSRSQRLANIQNNRATKKSLFCKLDLFQEPISSEGSIQKLKGLKVKLRRSQSIED